jgi:hypothetical protein
MYHPTYGWLQDDHIYERIIGWRAPVARWAGGDLNWMFGRAGTGPAGTGHWAVGLRPMEWNLALMSSRQFQNYLHNYYGINLNTNDGRWEAALAMSQRPTASEFSSYIAPALGAKGIVFDNETWLTVTIKPAVYAGGLEAENQIAMGLTVAINISLGILKKDYLGALSMRNNSTQGEDLSVLHSNNDPNWFKTGVAIMGIVQMSADIASHNSKPLYMGPKAWAAEKALAKSFSKKLGIAGMGVTVLDATIQGKWENHHTADLIIGGVTTFLLVSNPITATIAGSYFLIDLGFQFTTGKGITEHLFD